MAKHTYNVTEKIVQVLEKIGTPADYAVESSADYVVESSNNANWTWLKFSSGKCIAWYYASYTCTWSGSAFAGGWYVTNWEASIPSGLFNATPTVTSSVKSSNCIVTNPSPTSTKDKLIIHMIRPSSGSENVMMEIQCMGTWK